MIQKLEHANAGFSNIRKSDKTQKFKLLINGLNFITYQILSLVHGGVKYEEVVQILNSFKYTHIYVKREQKQQIILELFDMFNIKEFHFP